MTRWNSVLCVGWRHAPKRCLRSPSNSTKEEETGSQRLGKFSHNALRITHGCLLMHLANTWVEGKRVA